MMKSSSDPGSSDQQARHLLGQSIRELREAAQIKGQTLARVSGTSQGQISKIEQGKAAPTTASLRLMLSVLKPAPEIEARVLRLFDSLVLPEGDLDKIIKLGVDLKQRQFREMEARASRIRNVETVIVSGLLQTPDYARSMLSRWGSMADKEIEAAVAERAERQTVLDDDAKMFEFVMLESALWSFAGPVGQHLRQLDHLVRTMSRPNVRIGVVPVTAVVPPLLTSFWLFDDRYVSAETIASEVVSISQESIERYAGVFDQLSRVADAGEAETIISNVRQHIEAAKRPSPEK